MSPSFEDDKEPNHRTTVFGKTAMEPTHGRATEDDTPTKDCPKNQPHDDREEIIAEALVATGNT